MSDFSWDEVKRLRTIEDRGLDFVRARYFFDGRPVVHQFTPRNGEDRWKTSILMDDAFYQPGDEVGVRSVHARRCDDGEHGQFPGDVGDNDNDHCDLGLNDE